MRPQVAPITIDQNLKLVVNGAQDGNNLDLFNARAFHDLHAPHALRSFHCALADNASGVILGTINIHERSAGEMASPFRGSFGGFALVPDASRTLEEMDGFVGGVETMLAVEGAESLSVVVPPLVYHPDETSAWIDVLLRRGFVISRHELSYGIHVTGEFVDGIDSGNRKRLQKCIRDGLESVALAREEFEDAYTVVAENRRKRGYTLSMSWETFREMADALPERVACFAVRRGAEMIAAALCLRINAKALYVAHWGEIPGVEAWSPVTLLASSLFDYCRDSGIRLLDLGTANVDGVPNAGLIRYKKNLGCAESLKLTLDKRVA